MLVAYVRRDKNPTTRRRELYLEVAVLDPQPSLIGRYHYAKPYAAKVAGGVRGSFYNLHTQSCPVLVGARVSSLPNPLEGGPVTFVPPAQAPRRLRLIPGGETLPTSGGDKTPTAG